MTLEQKIEALRQRYEPPRALWLSGHSNQTEIAAHIGALRAQLAAIETPTTEQQASITGLDQAGEILNREFRPDLDAIWPLIAEAELALGA